MGLLLCDKRPSLDRPEGRWGSVSKSKVNAPREMKRADNAADGIVLIMIFSLVAIEIRSEDAISL